MFRAIGVGLGIVAAWASSRPPAADDDVPAEFAALVAAMREVLPPISPSPSFRQGLGRDLVALARQKNAPQVLLQRRPSYRRRIIIGAAVSSAVSVAGLIAVIWRRRSHQVAQHA